jgi:hypothetical protein
MTPPQAISRSISAAQQSRFDTEQATKLLLAAWIDQQPDALWARNELNKWALLMRNESDRDMIFRIVWELGQKE